MFEKSEYSPSNFDALQRDQQLICTWYADVEEKLRSVDLPALERSEIFFEDLPKLETDAWNYELVRLNRIKADHDEFQSKLKKIKDQSEWSPIQTAYAYFSPFVLAIALGLQIGKSQYG